MTTKLFIIRDLSEDDLDVEGLNLSPVDTKRYAKMGSGKKKKEFLFTRHCLSQILAKQFAVSLAQFTKSEDGKPVLEDSDIDMSLSHSGDYFVLFFQEAGEAIGVDIETKKTEKGYASIAKKHFSEGENEWLSEAESDEEKMIRFRDLWSLKEAYFKAQSTGEAQTLVKELDFAMSSQVFTAAEPGGCFYKYSGDLFSLSLFAAHSVDIIEVSVLDFIGGELASRSADSIRFDKITYQDLS